MASNHAFNALILYTTDMTMTAAEDLQVSQPHGKWALLLGSLSNPSPGRTLDQLYTFLGRVLETQINRAAYSFGLGPHVVALKINSHFGIGEERAQHLELLRSSIPDKLQKICWRLMKYTLPVESAKTQFQAFRDIVNLVTLFPGLRVHFLRAKCIESTSSTEPISALWDRPSGPPDEEWTFWQTFAATCLSDTPISAILEESSIWQLTTCDERSLSVIERLLVEHDCSGTSNICGALAIRYLGGILDLPGFWLDTGNVHSDVAKKLCSAMVRVLKDIGADILTLGPINESDPPFDYNGVDFFATTVLAGLSSWFAKCDKEHWVLQAWYTDFRTCLNILRGPRSVDLLPNASACATGAFENILTTVHHHAQVDIVVDAPGEGGIFENKDTVHNEPLPDLNSTDAASMDFVEQEDHAESRGSPQEDDTVSWDAESRGSLHENDIDIEIHESNGESMDSESIIEGSRPEPHNESNGESTDFESIIEGSRPEPHILHSVNVEESFTSSALLKESGPSLPSDGSTESIFIRDTPSDLDFRPHPRVVQLRNVANELGKLFPADKAVLDGLIPADPELQQRARANDSFFVDPRGPPPGDGDTLIHVFIDHSNILIGLLTYLKRYPRILKTHNSSSVPVTTTATSSTPQHLSHAALALILERGRPITRRVLVTSSPLYQPMDTAERLAYEVRVYARVPGLGDGQDRVGSAGSGHGQGRQGHSRSLSAGAGGLMGFTNGNGNVNANVSGNGNANGAGGVPGELPPLRNPRWGSNGNGGGGEANGNGNGGGGGDGRKRKGHVLRISGSRENTSEESEESEQEEMMNGMPAAAAGFPQAFIRSLGGAHANGGSAAISTAMSPASYESSPISSSLPMSNGLDGFSASPIPPTATAGYAPNEVSPPSAVAKIRYREQGVDELLQLKLHQALAALDGPPPPGATIVLATSDGNVGQFNEDGFLCPVRTALKKGWRVELYAWEEGLSRAWMREFGEWTKPVDGEATGRFRVVGMEQFAWELLEIY